MRKIKFQNGYYYHIYNRGVDKREVFCDEKDYFRFLRSMREFNQIKPIESLYRQNELRRKEAKPLRFEKISHSDNFSNRSGLASLIAYCLNPNHFHLLLKQKENNGIAKFMHKLSTGYTRYFNAKNNRTGSLFTGTYKSVPIKSDSQLLYVSAYINGNPEIHKILKYDKWKYSSCLDYLEKRKGSLCDKKVVLDEFKDIKDYQEYINIVIKNSSEIKEEIKKCLME